MELKTIRVDDRLHRRLRDESHRSGETIAAIVTLAVNMELRRRKAERAIARQLAGAGRAGATLPIGDTQ